jgi:hypothetical protein
MVDSLAALHIPIEFALMEIALRQGALEVKERKENGNYVGVEYIAHEPTFMAFGVVWVLQTDGHAICRVIYPYMYGNIEYDLTQVTTWANSVNLIGALKKRGEK